MKIKNFFMITLGLFFMVSFFGCAQQKQMYYWGSYSNTLYHAKENPCEESLAAHKEELENIITESQERGLRVPPGVAAELGYFYAKTNNTKKAIGLFQLEKNTYPESSVLMGRMILQAEKRSNDNNTDTNPVKDAIESEKSIGE